jgi:hypothetical protein
VQLATKLPRGLIEYHSGKAAISQDPDATPSVDLDPLELVKGIETAGAWTVLKRVENSPEYRQLLEHALLSVARARGYNSLLDAGFEQLEGFLFISPPNSTMPFHLDSEDNFFVQIHGEKFFTIFDNTDRGIVSEDEIERSMTTHRNLKYDEGFASRGTEFQLFAGDGCYVPYRPAGARCAEACFLSQRHHCNQTVAGVIGDAPPAAPLGTRQTRELLLEGRVRRRDRCPVCTNNNESVIPDAPSVGDSRPQVRNDES